MQPINYFDGRQMQDSRDERFQKRMRAHRCADDELIKDIYLAIEYIEVRGDGSRPSVNQIRRALPNCSNDSTDILRVVKAYAQFFVVSTAARGLHHYVRRKLTWAQIEAALQHKPASKARPWPDG